MAVILVFVFVVLSVFSGVFCDDNPYYTGFHYQPLENWMNDPNGPMYFNGYYHLFYQYNPTGPTWGDMHWGHAVSEDCVRWTHLPVALAPDQPYDCGGIFSGSATIVNGVPTISYSVACGTVVVLAVPANLSDPYLTNWTKPSYNPVMYQPSYDAGGGFRDPTTGWKGNDGVWRMAVGCQGGACLFTSENFVNWTSVGWLHQGNTMWECPDFYPVPGSDEAWVLKASANGQDWWSLGSYSQDPDAFHPYTYDILGGGQLYDFGKFYASKSFYDPSSDRQILWGWVAEEGGPARNWASIQSFPRTITIDPLNGTRLIFSPIEEITTLRLNSTSMGTQTLPPGSALQVPGVSSVQLEINATFQISPNQNATFGINVFVSPYGNESTPVLISTGHYGSYMVNTDLPGGDYYINNTFGDSNTPPSACEALCEADPICMAWVFVAAGVQMQDARCCLKNVIPAAVSSMGITSGVLNAPEATVLIVNDHVGAFPFSSDDVTLVNLRVLVDHSVVEGFAHEGRGVATGRVYPSAEATLVEVVNLSQAEVTLVQLDVYEMETVNIRPQ